MRKKLFLFTVALLLGSAPVQSAVTFPSLLNSLYVLTCLLKFQDVQYSQFSCQIKFLSVLLSIVLFDQFSKKRYLNYSNIWKDSVHGLTLRYCTTDIHLQRICSWEDWIAKFAYSDIDMINICMHLLMNFFLISHFICSLYNNNTINKYFDK
jgi:hypothetical protein